MSGCSKAQRRRRSNGRLSCRTPASSKRAQVSPKTWLLSKEGAGRRPTKDQRMQQGPVRQRHGDKDNGKASRWYTGGRQSYGLATFFPLRSFKFNTDNSSLRKPVTVLGSESTLYYYTWYHTGASDSDTLSGRTGRCSHKSPPAMGTTASGQGCNIRAGLSSASQPPPPLTLTHVSFIRATTPSEEVIIAGTGQRPPRQA